MEIGTPYELYSHPKTIFAANFVGEANFLEGKITEISNGVSIIDCGEGLILKSKETSQPVGQPVVAAIRPEFVSVNNEQSQDGIHGYVETEDFEGGAIRYEINVPGHAPFAIRVPQRLNNVRFNIGDELSLTISPDDVMMYPFPNQGLQSEISI